MFEVTNTKLSEFIDHRNEKLYLINGDTINNYVHSANTWDSGTNVRLINEMIKFSKVHDIFMFFTIT